MQKDGWSLQHHLQLPQDPANSGHYQDSQSTLQQPQPHHLCAFGTYNNGNFKFTAEMEKQVKKKLTGYIPNSLRSSVSDTVNLQHENTFSLDDSHSQVINSSKAAVESPKTKGCVGMSVSALNQSSLERPNSAQSAGGKMRKSYSLSSTFIKPTFSSTQKQASVNGGSSEVLDRNSEAAAGLLQSRSVVGSTSDGRGQSELMMQKAQSSHMKVNSGLASEDGRASSGLADRGNHAVTTRFGTMTKTDARQLPQTRRTSSAKASGQKQSTVSESRHVVNETIVVQTTQSASDTASSEVKVSQAKPVVSAESNQVVSNVASRKFAQPQKSVPSIPKNSGLSKLPAGSRRRESHPTETKSRVSESDSTRLRIAKPFGTDVS